MKVTVDKNKCIGCGTCNMIAPDIFQIDKENKSQVVGDPASVSEEVLKKAETSCPVGAIKIVKD
jgi:ferredoxin